MLHPNLHDVGDVVDLRLHACHLVHLLQVVVSAAREGHREGCGPHVLRSEKTTAEGGGGGGGGDSLGAEGCERLFGDFGEGVVGSAWGRGRALGEY